MTDRLTTITPNKASPHTHSGMAIDNHQGRSPRESTFESADVAAGIYSLYGDGVRDSLRGDGGAMPVSTNELENGHGTGSRSGPRTPLRTSIAEGEMENGEEHSSFDQHPLQNGNTHMDRSNYSDISRSSTGTGSQLQSRTPEIRLTPSKGQNGQGHNSIDTPTHPSISRLSPRRPHPLGGSTTSTATTSSISTGRVSSAGSSQYPGEEEDAFHVRSTCEYLCWRRKLAKVIKIRLTGSDARLEALGVHGDGWEAGVERTRGGPSSASKRATVSEAERDRQVSDKEREFLASLDRWVTSCLCGLAR
jgi:hypothetical protein